MCINLIGMLSSGKPTQGFIIEHGIKERFFPYLVRVCEHETCKLLSKESAKE